MQRMTISLDDMLAEAFDALAAERGYSSRSEAMRDLVRRAIDDHRLAATGSGPCVANLSYVYDHHTRDLARRLTGLQHAHHDLVISSTHVHLDRHSCLESVILKGPVDAVQGLARQVGAERGVRFAAVNLVGVPEAA